MAQATGVSRILVMNGETPKQQMTRLGDQHNALSAAWAKAYTSGLMVIQRALHAQIKENEQAQAELLAAFPSLVLMTMEK